MTFTVPELRMIAITLVVGKAALRLDLRDKATELANRIADYTGKFDANGNPRD